MSVDARLSVIARRLERVQRIIAVTGGKGGIGKTVVSSCLALTLARTGRRAGLLDLDLTSPCDHLVLGADCALPEEDYGVLPVPVSGVRFMSVACFSGEHPAPLRGGDLSNALIELLTIVQWGHLDFLVIDMPPGIGDAALDAVRLLPRAEFLAVATDSHVVVETVRRTLALLGQVDARILGVIENMRRHPGGERVRQLAAAAGVPFLGALPYDPELEGALGAPERLAATSLATQLERLIRAALRS